MNELLLVAVVLISNSILNIITWSIILGKAGIEVKQIFKQIQKTILLVKGEQHNETE